MTLPPQSLDAEQAVLGSMLIEFAAVAAAAKILKPTDFYHSQHRLLFETMLALQQAGQPIDLITVEDRLRATPTLILGAENALDALGGLSYLANLMEAPSTAANVTHYAALVKEKAIRREGMQRSREAYFLFKREADGLERLAQSNGRYHLSTLASELSLPVTRSTCISDVQTETVEWLWYGWLPFGKVVVLSGDPGLFKSGITLDIASRVTTGSPMPFSELKRAPMNVLLLAAEDGLGDTLRPRLEAAGADLNRVFAYTPDEIPDLTSLDTLQREIVHHQVKFVVIDPLLAFMPPYADVKSGKSMRRLLMTPLTHLSQATGCCVLTMCHLNKTTTVSNALYRSAGSMDIVAAARSAILCAKHPKNPQQFVFASTKSNLCKPPQSLSYHVESEADDAPPVVCWDGIADEYNSDNLLLTAPAEKTEERSALAEAEEFLREVLKDGPVPAEEVKRQARQLSISETSLKRAKPRIAASRRIGGLGNEGKWEFYLLTGTENPDTALRRRMQLLEFDPLKFLELDGPPLSGSEESAKEVNAPYNKTMTPLANLDPLSSDEKDAEGQNVLRGSNSPKRVNNMYTDALTPLAKSGDVLPDDEPDSDPFPDEEE